MGDKMRKLLIPLTIVILVVAGLAIMTYLNVNSLEHLNERSIYLDYVLKYDNQVVDNSFEDNSYQVLGFDFSSYNDFSREVEFDETPVLREELINSGDVKITNLNITLTQNDKVLLETTKYNEINQYFDEHQEDGYFQVRIVINYSYNLIAGAYTKQYDLKVDYPTEYIFDRTKLAKGDFATIRTKHANANDIILTDSKLARFSLKFYKEGDEYIGLLPIDYRNSLGTYCVNINSVCHEIEVIDKKFKEMHFNIDYSTLAVTSTKEAYAEYNREVSSALTDNEEGRMYEDQFIVPASGRLSSDFLDTRYINGSKTPSSYHSGIDIANEIGTEIYATASGIVVHAQFLQVTGNTIIMYHGNNLYSFYLHLDDMNVKAGQNIVQGAIIGKMGTTGMSTGSHLHFGIRIGSNYVNPWDFIEEDNNGKIYEK